MADAPRVLKPSTPAISGANVAWVASGQPAGSPSARGSAVEHVLVIRRSIEWICRSIDPPRTPPPARLEPIVREHVAGLSLERAERRVDGSAPAAARGGRGCGAPASRRGPRRIFLYSNSMSKCVSPWNSPKAWPTSTSRSVSAVYSPGISSTVRAERQAIGRPAGAWECGCCRRRRPRRPRGRPSSSGLVTENAPGCETMVTTARPGPSPAASRRRWRARCRR